MFTEAPASRLRVLSPLGIPQGAGVLHRNTVNTDHCHEVYCLIGINYTTSDLMLSRKSKLRFLAGGNVRETCWEEGLMMVTSTTTSTRSLILSFLVLLGQRCLLVWRQPTTERERQRASERCTRTDYD